MDSGPAQITAWVIVILTFMAIGFDLFVGFRFGAPATISRQLGFIAQQYPILAFAFGVVIGHIFWPLKL